MSHHYQHIVVVNMRESAAMYEQGLFGVRSGIHQLAGSCHELLVVVQTEQD